MTHTLNECLPEEGELLKHLQYCNAYFERLFQANFFKCLNDETRQKIILLVGQCGEEGMRVVDIVKHFDRDRTTISHHLAMLRDSGLLSMTKRGKERFYCVNVDYVIGALEEMVNILRSCCTRRRDELAGDESEL